MLKKSQKIDALAWKARQEKISSGGETRDLYEMRLIVEPEAAYYAATRASDEEI